MELTAIKADTERETFAAYVSDDATAVSLKAAVSELSWSPDMVFSGGIAGAVRALGAMPCPGFLIVDISTSEDPLTDVQALADVCDEGTVVLTIGTENDVSLYRDLLNAGVHDYLVKPLQADILRDALASAEEAMLAPEEEEVAIAAGEGRTILFLGLRGGIGTSTLATNIAWLKADAKQPTALLDLDLYFGTSAMMFDLEPGRGLADALENPGRVDSLFLERAVVKPHKNLAILCTEAPIGGIIPPSGDALAQLIEAMASNFQNVVVDVPRQLLGDNPAILETATDIVLVTDHSLASARDGIRMKAFIKNAAPSARLHIVANKQGSVPIEVEEKDFENSIEHNLDVKIPFDAKAPVTAAQKGKIICEGAENSKLAAAIKSVRALLEDSDKEDEASGSSWFSKLLKKQ